MLLHCEIYYDWGDLVSGGVPVQRTCGVPALGCGVAMDSPLQLHLKGVARGSWEARMTSVFYSD